MAAAVADAPVTAFVMNFLRETPDAVSLTFPRVSNSTIASPD